MSYIYEHEPMPLEDIPTVQKYGNLHEGRAAFMIEDIEIGTSKSGNPMAKFILQCVNEDGSTGKVWDNIPLIKSWEWKIGAYFKSCGLFEIYNKDKINIKSLINGKGWFVVGWEEFDGTKNLRPEEFTGKQKLKPKEFIYPDKQYTDKELTEFKFDDDIPF